LFFEADDGVHGGELWKSDGTRTGTVLVKDINPGAGASAPRRFTRIGDAVFFTADDGVHGSELWRSDGTAAGTVLVKDINPGAQGQFYSSSTFTEVGGTLFFLADDGVHGSELWKSDGTTPGTVLVKDIHPSSKTFRTHQGGWTEAGGTMFFLADDGVHGWELWRSDGTATGTVLVKDINPSANHNAYSIFGYPTDVDGTVFFGADDGVHGGELWKSDGTTAGTVLVKDVEPGPASDYLGHLAAVGGRLTFFRALRDGGSQLWRSDGTTAGTVKVKDLTLRRDYINESGEVAVAGDTLFMRASGARGSGLWKSDGTTAGTALVKDFDNFGLWYGPDRFRAVGGTLFFRGNDEVHGPELWKSDGTRAGTVLVEDIALQPSRYVYSGPGGLRAAGGRLFFWIDDGIHGTELWRSNGTRAGTALVKDISPPSNTFQVGRKGRADTARGTLRIRANLPGPGILRLAPLAHSKVKRARTSVAIAGTAGVTITPTRAGLRELKVRLRRAERQGRHVGKLPVTVRVTFAPTGGTPRSKQREYVLKLRR
jgi:ELWxxDGT repeat protein